MIEKSPVLAIVFITGLLEDTGISQTTMVSETFAFYIMKQ